VDRERYEMIKKRYAELPDPVYYSAPGGHLSSSVMGGTRTIPAAGCENMMLAAHALGLGTCWSASAPW